MSDTTLLCNTFLFSGQYEFFRSKAVTDCVSNLILDLRIMLQKLTIYPLFLEIFGFYDNVSVDILVHEFIQVRERRLRIEYVSFLIENSSKSNYLTKLRMPSNISS